MAVVAVVEVLAQADEVVQQAQVLKAPGRPERNRPPRRSPYGMDSVRPERPLP
jgi:hypothetical protein